MKEDTKHKLLDAIEEIGEATNCPCDAIIEVLTGVAFDEEDAGHLKATICKYLKR